jgi:hypothetical protein
MKALTIRQPWIHAILREGKNIENRWPDRHASFPRSHRVPDLATLDYSAICGVARVVDIVTKNRSKWFWQPNEGSVNYGWVLKDVTPLKKQIPCKGALGLWKLPFPTFRKLQRQLPRLSLDE